MELMWQTHGGQVRDIGLVRRIRSSQRQRPTGSPGGFAMKESHETNLINGEPERKAAQNHERVSAPSNIISLDRLTLLDEPITLDNTESEGEDEANLINENNVISSKFTTNNQRETNIQPNIPIDSSRLIQTPNIRQPLATDNKLNSTMTNRRSYLASHDNLPGMPAVAATGSDQNQQSSTNTFSSTTALLILLIIYIIWQCFRNHQGAQATTKCLDDWPATLLTPAKGRRRKRRESDGLESEMQTIEGFTSGSEQANSSSAKSAVLRMRPAAGGDSEQLEIEVIPTEQETTSRRPASGKMTGTLKESLARNSFVVAANRVARPRVKLIGDKMRRFVDIEAQDGAREGQDKIGDQTIRSRLVRILHSSGLIKALTGGNVQLDEGEIEAEPQLQVPMVNAQDVEFRQPQQTAIDTINVVVHREDDKSINQATSPTESRCESLLGFAGSFLESTVNPSTSHFLPPDSSQLSPSTPIPVYSSNVDYTQFCPTSSPIQVTANNNLNNIPCHNQHHEQRQQLVACDCALARSKSQTNQTTSCPVGATHLLGSSAIATNGSNLRPCCSVSPSAMRRHLRQQHQHQVATNGHHLCSQQAATSAFESGGSFFSEPQQLAQPVGRARHHYENYYDDEQEDAYRRLTASIGMQFGLALDQQTLIPNAAGCSTACKCNSAAALTGPSNFACHQVGDHHQLPPNKSSGLSSAGDSDSGVNCGSQPVATAESENNICNDSTCSLCSSSLLTAASTQDAGCMPLRRPSWDPTSGHQHGLAPVPRWYQQRRSMLHPRQQPRRTSIAGVVSNPSHQQSIATEIGAQHFLHRASIASDGATSNQHQHYPPNAHHHPYLGPMTGGASDVSPKLPMYPMTCQSFYTPKASGYCSSAGSSSGIGFSGSQCLNTPTTGGGGVHSYGSFAASKAYCDLGYHLGRDETSAQHDVPLVCQFALAESAQTRACPAWQELITMNSSNRKFSLPAQLESHAAGQLMSNRYNPLFCGSQCDDIERGSQAEIASNEARPPPIKRSLTQGRKIVSPPDARRLADQNANRRLSQIITRQSSFWLEDDISLESIVDPLTNNETVAGRDPASNDQQQAVIETDPTQSSSSAFCPSSSANDETQSSEDLRKEHPPTPPPPEASTSSGKRHQRIAPSSSSSSTSSPSPDFSALRYRQRLLSRASQSTAITKKRLLGSLKQRRPRRHSNTHSLTRSRQGYQSSTPRDITQALKRQGTSSTDDERDKSKDGLSSFDREVATVEELSRITTIDANSTSLERQCRDLWKLRATLHGDDGSIGDNWTNYHQRLNRRYDSGYKSIENQFSSSLEGNLPNMMNLSLRQASPIGDNGRTTARESDRPRSGCSGLIQERSEETTLLDANPATLNEEETQSLLENCDEQQDER